jgi:putative transposase
MPGIARVVVPGERHLVTQRGNRRQETFFPDEDYEARGSTRTAIIG